jgi:hypothetical protein
MKTIKIIKLFTFTIVLIVTGYFLINTDFSSYLDFNPGISFKIIGYLIIIYSIPYFILGFINYKKGE